MSMQPYTDNDWDTLPHVILTGDTDWDPSIFDNIIDNDDEWFDALSDLPDNVPEPLFDLQGNYRRRHTVHYVNIDSPELQDGLLPSNPSLYTIHEIDTESNERKLLLRTHIMPLIYPTLHGNLLIS